MGEIIGFITALGGCGKSTLVTNLGFLRAAGGAKTLLIDFNHGARKLDLYTGLADAVVTNLYDVTNRRMPLSDAVIASPGEARLHLLAASQTRPAADIDPAGWRQLLTAAAAAYETVLIDYPPGFREPAFQPVDRLNRLLFVCTPEPYAVRCTDKLLGAFRGPHQAPQAFIVNKIVPELEKVGVTSAETQLRDQFGLPLLGLLPFDRAFISSTRAGDPVNTASGKDYAKALKNIAGRLAGAEIPFLNLSRKQFFSWGR